MDKIKLRVVLKILFLEFCYSEIRVYAQNVNICTFYLLLPQGLNLRCDM